MAKTAYINARVEKKLKDEAAKTLKRVGINTSDAVSLFLQQVIYRQGLPFDARIPNKETKKAIRDLRSGKGRVYTGDTKNIFDALERRR